MEEEFRLTTAGHNGPCITRGGGGIVTCGGSRDGLREGHGVRSGVDVRDERTCRNAGPHDGLTDRNARNAGQDDIIAARIRIRTRDGGTRGAGTPNHLIGTRVIAEHTAGLNCQNIVDAQEGNLRTTPEVEGVGGRVTRQSVSVVGVEAGIRTGGKERRGARAVQDEARSRIIGRKAQIGTSGAPWISALGDGPATHNAVGQRGRRASVDPGFGPETRGVRRREKNRTASGAGHRGER